MNFSSKINDVGGKALIVSVPSVDKSDMTSLALKPRGNRYFLDKPNPIERSVLIGFALYELLTRPLALEMMLSATIYADHTKGMDTNENHKADNIVDDQTHSRDGDVLMAQETLILCRARIYILGSKVGEHGKAQLPSYNNVHECVNKNRTVII
uniref:Uncharacterized protein n=1 Tax=Glossina pallidipes TaxID=7398 RepID=A0A1A9ZU94_GLOPL